ncbi:MAG: glycosyltransferase family 2 protein [Candidatus Hodarchaeota archaeon]
MKVSIITVSLNSEATIEDCIKSVLNQSYKNIEYIVIDGASVDQTVDIIKKYEDRISKWISENDKSIYDAMNKGITLATGDVIGFINSDDMYYDSKAIERIVSAFEKDIDCIYGNLVYVSHRNIKKITRRWISNDFKDGLFERSWTPAHPTFYCRKKAYDKFGGYRLDFQIASDVELMYRFLQKYRLKSKFISTYLVKMRDRGVSNRRLKSTIIITKEMKKAIKENGGNFNLFKYLLFKLLKIKQILFKNWI